MMNTVSPVTANWVKEMVAEGNVSPDTLLAMGMLIDGLDRRQHQARERQEDVRDAPIVFVGPEVESRFSVDQLGSDPDPVLGAADATLEDGFDAPS